MSLPDYMRTASVVACADLAERCGATGFTFGYLREGVPIDRAGWYAEAEFHGTVLRTDEQSSPEGAANALAEQLLRGAICRCAKPVSLSDGKPNTCRWQLVGRRWESSCQAPPLKVTGGRGDVEAMRQAMAQRAEELAEPQWTVQVSGPSIHIPAEQVNRDDAYPPYDPRSGDHLWVAVASFKVTDPDADPVLMDGENLLNVDVGCWYCGRAYNRKLKRKRCPGEPQ